MLGLAIDTSGPYLGLMLYNQDSRLQSIQHTASRDHCASLIPQIQSVLENHNQQLSDVDQWSVVIGPGSFTGLRVGVMTIKTLAMTTTKSIVTVHNFDRLALTHDKHPSSTPLGLIWPAQKGHVYISVQHPAKNADLIQPSFVPWGDVPWTAAQQWLYPDWLTPEYDFPANAQSVTYTALTTDAWHTSIQQSTQQEDAHSLEPWYIQPSYAKKVATK